MLYIFMLWWPIIIEQSKVKVFRGNWANLILRASGETITACAFARGWIFISGVWWWLTCPCVCLCASRWPVTLWPCTLDRSRRAMSVSVNQIGIDRSLDRPIDQSWLPGQSLDQSICVCRCLYKEQHPPTRSHFRRKILCPVDLFSLFISSLWSFARPHHLSTKSRYIAWSRQKDPCRRSFRNCALSSWSRLRKWNAEHILELRGEINMLDVWKVATEKLRTCRGTRRRGPRKWNEKRRTMHRRSSWVPRTKLHAIINCLSNFPLCIYIHRYINILYKYCTYAYICTCVWYDVCTRLCRERDKNSRGCDKKERKVEKRTELCEKFLIHNYTYIYKYI